MMLLIRAKFPALVTVIVGGEQRFRSQFGLEEPLESLLGAEGLARLGAIMAVDREGVLRGVVTIESVRRALRGTAPA